MRTVFPGKDAVRTWRHLCEEAADYWCLAILDPRTPGSAIMADEAIGLRQLRLQSLSQPLGGQSVDANILAMLFPRDSVQDLITIRRDARLVIADAGLGAILIDFLLTLEQRLPGLRAEELPSLAEATRGMIAACLKHQAGDSEAVQEQSVRTRMQRARELIQSNLDSTAFGSEDLVRLLGISRSGLYRMFEPFGGVVHFIQHQRLLKAHQLLSDPSNLTPIFKIAEDLCFGDPSSFSRAFKQEFGLSPSEIRANAGWRTQGRRLFI